MILFPPAYSVLLFLGVEVFYDPVLYLGVWVGSMFFLVAELAEIVGPVLACDLCMDW